MSSTSKTFLNSLLALSALAMSSGQDNLYSYDMLTTKSSKYIKPEKSDHGQFVIQSKRGYLQSVEPEKWNKAKTNAFIFDSFSIADAVRGVTGGKIRRL